MRSSRPMPSGRGTGRPKKRQNRENSASSKSVVTKKKVVHLFEISRGVRAHVSVYGVAKKAESFD